MIVIDRKTGVVIQPEELTAEQRADAWERILQAYLAAHPEALQEAMRDAAAG